MKKAHGNKGRVLTEEHKAKLSEAAQGRKLSADCCAKISAAHKGREFTVEARCKMSEAAKQRGAPKHAIAAAAMANRGKKFSDEHKKALSKAWTPERKSKESLRMKNNSIASIFTAEGKAALATAVMSRHQAKERTSLELSIANLFKSRGIDFFTQQKIDGDSHHLWDFILPQYNAIVEADGCYWHGCKHCGHRGLGVNHRNDKAKNTMANKLGWNLIRIKGCDNAANIIDSVFCNQ